jgi:hypothetical protein
MKQKKIQRKIHSNFNAWTTTADQPKLANSLPYTKEEARL